MTELGNLIKELKESPEFAEDFERGYEAFRLGAMLRLAREEAGLTQQQVADRLHTQKSAISRMENHAADIRLSTLQRYADAVGCRLILELRPAEDEAPAAAPTRVERSRRRLVAADTNS